MVTGTLNPFTITLWDRNLHRLQGIGDPIYANFTPRFPGLGSGEFQLRADDPANEWLQQPGCRMTVWYRGEHLMSGFVSGDQGDLTPGGTATYYVTDDATILFDTLGLVAPTATITPATTSDTAQGVNGGYYAFTSTIAETAIKQIITDNCVTRPYPIPVTVPTDLARGGTITPPLVRMTAISDAIAAICTQSGLAVRAYQVPGDTQITIDVIEPTIWPQHLTYASGVLQSGIYSSQALAATRIYLGGPGNADARAWYEVDDATGLETATGRRIEVAKDATGATLNWGSVATADQIPAYYLVDTGVADADKTAFRSYLQQSGNAALGNGAPTSGLEMKLAETASFHYGGSDGFHVADTVTVLAGGDLLSDQITECTIAWTTAGLTVTPVVGIISADADKQLADAIKQLSAALRRQATGR